jgi:hypothetical protein
MSALIQQLALLSESDRVDMGDLMRVSAALQRQATRDLALLWDVSATVDAFENLEDVPIGYWPMIVMDDIGFNAAGIHLDNNKQPFALISASDDVDVWSLTASHESVEMLVDPFGNKLIAGDSPNPDQGRVNFLVEVADPSESAEFAYSVNGVLVSDFYTPRYFDPVAAPGIRYSFTGAIREPRDVLRGGYLSWVDPATNIWWQETWFGGPSSQFVELGPLDASEGSLRAQIDRRTARATAEAARPGRRVAGAAGLTAARGRETTTAWAGSLRNQISALVGSPSSSRAEPRGEMRERGAEKRPRKRDRQVARSDAGSPERNARRAVPRVRSRGPQDDQ